MECTELKKRIDTKVGIDDKMKDRDTNSFMKFLGKISIYLQKKYNFK